MKYSVTASAFCFLALLAVMMTGCAGLDSPQQEQMLSAAGFTIQTPDTPKRREIYDMMEPYKLVSGTVHGRLLFAYKQPEKGIVYVGNEANYQRYQAYALQRNIAQQQVMAAQMNQAAMMRWSYWGAPGAYWW